MSGGPRRIGGILFDKDGTLLDYAASWGPINREAGRLAAAGDMDLAERLLAIAGVDPHGGVRDPQGLLAAGSTNEIALAWHEAGAPFAIAALTEALDRLFQANVARVIPVCALVPVFERLAGRGLTLGIASSDSEAAIRATAERFGIAGHLSFVAGYDSGHGRKPGPGMALAFCAATGLAPSAIAVVGDTAHDMHMGRQAGAGLCVGVLTGTSSRAHLAPLADATLDSIADLDQFLHG